MSEASLRQPAHMGFEQAWDLAGEPNPALLNGYLTWLLSDPERMTSAVGSMQWFPPGFSSFLIAREANPDGSTRQSLQLNMYHEDFPGNEEPHGHSRNARATWYALPGTQQIISRYGVLDPQAPRIEGLETVEAIMAGNLILDLKDGRRPIYNPVELGAKLLVKHSVTEVAPLGSQDFSSVETHHVAFRGKGVAVSVHYKGPEESARLSEVEGLVHYKRVPRDEAQALVQAREDLVSSVSNVASVAGRGDARLGPITMMFMMDLDAPMDSFQDNPVATAPNVAERLIDGALRTSEVLKAAA